MRTVKFLTMTFPHIAACLIAFSTLVAAAQSASPPLPPPASADSATTPIKPLGPVRVSGAVIAGQMLPHQNPVYPAEAKAKGISGTVVLHAIIGKDGTIKKLVAISGPDLLRQASLDAVSQWTYKPYLLNDQAVEVDTTITVAFNLGTPPPRY